MRDSAILIRFSKITYVGKIMPCEASDNLISKSLGTNKDQEKETITYKSETIGERLEDIPIILMDLF